MAVCGGGVNQARAGIGSDVPRGYHWKTASIGEAMCIAAAEERGA
jgi:hypothetical protein